MASLSPATQASSTLTSSTLTLGDVQFEISRPHRFGVVIHGLASQVKPTEGTAIPPSRGDDYLHKQLLSPALRDVFLELIETEGLVVCKNVNSNHSTYRKVRGKSSAGKLSQAEYYHHDGCSCPTKPRVVEIRLPHQDVGRDVATAIAPFGDVVRAMLTALPENLKSNPKTDSQIIDAVATFSLSPDQWPAPSLWDKIQGRITRLVRREMDAETCRAWFRRVDELAEAYVLPWEMGESRLVLNNHVDLSRTYQHRRSMQKPKSEIAQNGSLVKRWTAEEYPEQSCAIK